MLPGQKISEFLGLRVKYHSEETKEQISKTLTPFPPRAMPPGGGEALFCLRREQVKHIH